MKKVVASVFVLSLMVFWGSASAFAKNAQAESSSAGQTAAPAKKAATHHHATSSKAAKAAAKLHSLSGTISMVDATKKIVVLTDSNGVPFDFIVTRATHIEVSGKKATLSELADQTNKQASVKYMDRMKAGQLARSIEVSE